MQRPNRIPPAPRDRKKRDPWLFFIFGILAMGLVAVGAVTFTSWFRPAPARPAASVQIDDAEIPTTPMTPQKDDPFAKDFRRQHPNALPEDRLPR